jgi:hypothetical protein
MNTACIATCLISFTKKMPKPDLYVYLYQNSERLLQNIKKEDAVMKQKILPIIDKINEWLFRLH